MCRSWYILLLRLVFFNGNSNFLLENFEGALISSDPYFVRKMLIDGDAQQRYRKHVSFSSLHKISLSQPIGINIFSKFQ